MTVALTSGREQGARRGFLWDCDAVLYAREFEHLYQDRNWRGCLALALGRPVSDDEWLIFRKSLKTPGAWPEHLEKIHRVLTSQFGCSLSVGAIRECLLSAISEHTIPVEGLAPQDYVEEILELVSQAGVPRAVVTSAFLPYTSRILGYTNLVDFFHDDHIITAETVELSPSMDGVPKSYKPGPYPWLLAAARLGMTHLDSFEIFEDNPKNGVLAAVCFPNSRAWIITRDGKSVEDTWRTIRTEVKITEEVATFLRLKANQEVSPGSLVGEEVLSRVTVDSNFGTAHESLRQIFLS